MLRFLSLTLSTLIVIISGSAPAAQAAELVRLDHAVSAAVSDTARQQAILDSLRPAIDAMAKIGILESPDLHGMEQYAESRAFKFFEPEVEARLDSAALTCSIDTTLLRLPVILPGFNTPRHIYGIITPYNQAVMNVDSVMLVGLNHYLGKDFGAYSYFEPYIRRQKDSRLAPYHVAESLVQQSYPMLADSTTTALSHMIHDGAVTAAVMASVPEASLADAGGWTAEELQWLKQHEKELLQDIREKKIIESTDPKIISQLLAPSPGTLMFENHAPGRTGRYIGYRIVRSYLDSNPSATIADLLMPSGYIDQATAIAQNYAP